MFNQTLKDIEHIHRDVAGYDMNYDEFKELCRKSWEEGYNYLCIDRSKKEIKENIVFVLKVKKRIQKQHLRRNLFENIWHIFTKVMDKYKYTSVININDYVLILLNVIFD